MSSRKWESRSVVVVDPSRGAFPTQSKEPHPSGWGAGCIGRGLVRDLPWNSLGESTRRRKRDFRLFCPVVFDDDVLPGLFEVVLNHLLRHLLQ